MGFDNITEANGLGIAVAGITIVFAALVFISVFIYLLPILLSVFPTTEATSAASEPGAPTSTPTAADEEIVAAIAFALHQRDA